MDLLRCPQLPVLLETRLRGELALQGPAGDQATQTPSPRSPETDAASSGRWVPRPALGPSLTSTRQAQPHRCRPLWASLGEAAHPCWLSDCPSSERPARPRGGGGEGHTGRLLPPLLLGSDVAASCRIPKHPHSPSEGKAPKAVLMLHPGPGALEKCQLND